MEKRTEGVAFTPVPLARLMLPRGGAVTLKGLREQGAPPCEMCGTPVLAAHCKRICLRCGFMTGCSEGI